MTDDAQRPAHAAYVPETPWGVASAIAVTLVAAIAPMLLSLAVLYASDAQLVVEGDGPPKGLMPSLSSPFVLAQMIAGQVLSLGIIWIAAGRKGQRAATLRLEPPQTGWLTSVGYGALLIALIGPIELLLYHLAGIDLFTDGKWLLQGLQSPYWWAVILAAAVLAPLWEEITFRGFLLSALAKSRMGYWPAALISAVLWTVLHLGYSWPGLISVFLAGIGMSWIMLRTGSMRAVVVAHGVVNAFSLIVISLFAK